MNHHALSELHKVPQSQTVNTKYYIESILEETYTEAMSRRPTNGSTLKRSMIEDMSTAVFMQDNASCHNSKETQKWCKENCQNFWEVGVYPGNSPDLNPIEDLSSILQQEFNLPFDPVNFGAVVDEQHQKSMESNQARSARKLSVIDARTYQEKY